MGPLCARMPLRTHFFVVVVVVVVVVAVVCPCACACLCARAFFRCCCCRCCCCRAPPRCPCKSAFLRPTWSFTPPEGAHANAQIQRQLGRLALAGPACASTCLVSFSPPRRACKNADFK